MATTTTLGASNSAAAAMGFVDEKGEIDKNLSPVNVSLVTARMQMRVEPGFFERVADSNPYLSLPAENVTCEHYLDLVE